MSRFTEDSNIMKCMSEKPTCFVIMPISTPSEYLATYGGDTNHFIHVLEHLFVPAVEDAGFIALRPVAEGAELIHAEIVRKLETSDLVLCDMSTRNANVFFELGIRTALNKPVCLVKDEHLAQAPFDTTLINHHTYRSPLALWTIREDVAVLSRHIAKSMVDGSSHNNLWSYFGLATSSRLISDASANEKLSLIVDLLRQTSKPPLEFSSIAGSRLDDATKSFKSEAQVILAPYEGRYSWGYGTTGHSMIVINDVPPDVVHQLEEAAGRMGVPLAIGRYGDAALLTWRTGS